VHHPMEPQSFAVICAAKSSIQLITLAKCRNGQLRFPISGGRGYCWTGKFAPLSCSTNTKPPPQIEGQRTWSRPSRRASSPSTRGGMP
jgi:hypothetical protein